MTNLDDTEHAIELVAFRLLRTKPAIAHELAVEARLRIENGAPKADVCHWHLVQLVTSLHACDGSAFGAVIDDDSDQVRHAGGRKRVVSDDTRLRFLKHMKCDTSLPVKLRVRSFVESNPWCKITEKQLDGVWRNRNR